MENPKAPDRRYVITSAAALSPEQVTRAVSNTDGIARKMAMARGRFARQQHKLELLRMIVDDAQSGRYPLSPAQIQLAAYPFHYLLAPHDLIPDAVPVAGYSDDLAVIVIAWKELEDELKAYATWKGLRYSSYFDIHEDDT